MSDCIFCKIIAGSIPSNVIYEDGSVLGFLDIHPINPGHALVIPKRHVEFYTDLTPDEAGAVARIGGLVGRHLKKCISECAGLTYSVAEGRAANQEVPHVHLHVIPRHAEDGFGWRFPPGYGPVAPMESLRAMSEIVATSIKQG